MTADLGDVHEARSFLVPAYEFEQGSFLKDFDPDRKTVIGPVNGPDDTYGPIHRDERRFLPRASSQFLFSAAALFNPSVGETDRPFSIRLQETPAEKPAGVRSTCLTVEGRRLSAWRRNGRTDLMPSFAAWQLLNGGDPWWVERIHYSPDGSGRLASKTVAAHWSGRGALCAVVEGVTRLLLVEFQLYDDQPDRPDLLKVWASRHALSAGVLPARLHDGRPFDQDWQRLILRALQGFSEECSP